MSRSRKAGVEDAVVAFMAQFARYLIAAGVPIKRFEAISRLGYYLAASEEAKFGNRRVNQSAVAAMTGLTRVQVRRFAKQRQPVPNEARDRIDSVLEGWTTDPAFLDLSSGPKPLRQTGSGVTFATLVKAYGGDVPARAILRELERHDLVSIDERVVSLKASAASKRAAEYRLRTIARALADLVGIESRANIVTSRVRAVQLEALYPTAGSKGRILLEKRASEGMKAFLKGFEAAAEAAAATSPPTRRRSYDRSKAKLVLIMEEPISKTGKRKGEAGGIKKNSKESAAQSSFQHSSSDG
jgi:hypothetical protein